jgi:cation:H+ antiporter
MLIEIILLIFGLLLLVKGADFLVDGASALAKKYKISDLAIGLTIVAFGTSMPELVVNVIASIQNNQDIVLGNVIGSNNFNLFIILGIAGIISPLIVQSSTIWKEIPISLIAVLLLFIFANDFFSSDLNIITRLDGFILLIFFGLFLFYVYKQLKTDDSELELTHKSFSNFKIGVYIILGLAGLFFGGRIVVINAVEIAQILGVSEKIIGLTILATGTSLPELATSVMAAIKKNNDIAVGNIIGSNIFNIFLILSASSLINPIKYNNVFNTDLYILAGGTIFVFIAMFTGKKKKLDRWEASILLIFYLCYIIYLVSKEF